MTATTLRVEQHVTSKAITYAAAVIFCEFADLESITFAAAVISFEGRSLTPQQWSSRAGSEPVSVYSTNRSNSYG